MKDYLLKPEEFSDIWNLNLSIPIPTIDIVIFTIYKWELCLVLWKDKKRFWNKYAIPWWIVSAWFSLEENFDSILKRETGITGVYKEQLYTFWGLWRDDRWHTISISYFALVKADKLLTTADFTKVDLIKYKEMNNLNFFYDHKDIIKYAKQRLKWKLEYTNMAKDLLDDNFRISQLQEVYEIILSKKIDKRNFQKKIFKLGMLKDTWKLDKSTNRPAKLYSFKDKKLTIYEVL